MIHRIVLPSPFNTVHYLQMFYVLILVHDCRCSIDDRVHCHAHRPPPQRNRGAGMIQVTGPLTMILHASHRSVPVLCHGVQRTGQKESEERTEHKRLPAEILLREPV